MSVVSVMWGDTLVADSAKHTHTHISSPIHTPDIHTQGVGDPPSEAATARSRQPTGGPVRAPAAHHPTKPAHHVTKAAHHVTKAATGGPKMSTAVHCGDHPALPDRLVERLNAGDWEDRLEAINVLERFVDHHPKALEPHMNKVQYTQNSTNVTLSCVKCALWII